MLRLRPRRESAGATYVAAGAEIAPASFSAATWITGRGGLTIKTQYERH